MNFYSFVFLAILAVVALAQPPRVIEKTTIIQNGGPGFGRGGFNNGPGGFNGGFNRGPGFGRNFGGPGGFNRGPGFGGNFGGPGGFNRGPPTTVIRETVIRG